MKGCGKLYPPIFFLEHVKLRKVSPGEPGESCVPARAGAVPPLAQGRANGAEGSVHSNGG